MLITTALRVTDMMLFLLIEANTSGGNLTRLLMNGPIWLVFHLKRVKSKTLAKKGNQVKRVESKVYLYIY